MSKYWPCSFSFSSGFWSKAHLMPIRLESISRHVVLCGAKNWRVVHLQILCLINLKASVWHGSHSLKFLLLLVLSRVMLLHLALDQILTYNSQGLGNFVVCSPLLVKASINLILFGSGLRPWLLNKSLKKLTCVAWKNVLIRAEFQTVCLGDLYHCHQGLIMVWPIFIEAINHQVICYIYSIVYSLVELLELGIEEVQAKAQPKG